MTRFTFALILVASIVVGVPRSASLEAQDAPDFSGRWTLNRGLSQFPREIGFNADWLGQIGPGQAAPAGGGGRGGGRRGGGGGNTGGGAVTGTSKAVRESQEDAERVQRLSAEVREPSMHLTIVDTPAAITITDDDGKSRTFHPTGKEEVLPFGSTTIDTITTRDAGRLVILYKVEQGRDLRYTFTRTASPAQLLLDVQFIERSGGDNVKRVYDLAVNNPPAADATSAAGARSASGDRVAGQPFNQQPGAELKGLTQMGVVVEDLTAQAAACGLNQGTLETAVAKRLADAGFKVLRNTDEDTYLYVNIITTTASAGLCVSRYDVFLYTHTTARLSYQNTPVLVQVELLHKGSLAGGAPAAHADGVLKGVQEYVDQFAARVRGANQ